jgi:hypothetical protein
MGGFGIGGGSSKNKSKNKHESRTEFPKDFFNDAYDYFGKASTVIGGISIQAREMVKGRTSRAMDTAHSSGSMPCSRAAL